MTLRLITAPSGSIMSLPEATAMLGITDTSQDTYLTALVDVATNLIEFETQRLYRAQTWEWVRGGFDDVMRLPLAAGGGTPNMAINSVKYAGLNAVQQTLDPGLYWVRPAGETQSVVRTWFAVWPWVGDAAERVVISFSATSGVTVPSFIKQAGLLTLANLYRTGQRAPNVVREVVEGVGQTNYQTTLAAQAVYDNTVQHLLSFDRWS